MSLLELPLETVFVNKVEIPHFTEDFSCLLFPFIHFFHILIKEMNFIRIGLADLEYLLIVSLIDQSCVRHGFNM